jgi:hypothetical protein
MAQFKGCLIHGMKRGEGGNGRRMRCGARGSSSVAGEAGAALGGGGSRYWGRSPASVQKEEEEVGWAEWAKQAGSAARLAGPKSEENFFLEQKLDF